MRGLKGKVAAITGAGSGIGQAAAVRLGEEGCKIAVLDWKAESAVKGQITATFANGMSYSGMLYQITSDTTVEDMGPLWIGWRGGWGGWGGWDYWDNGPEFITHYSGRVVANLKDPDGARMRCNFRLINPSRGMAGGGEGKCQLTDGHTIDATFPSA